MKNIYILVSYLAVSLPLAHANLKSLSIEFLENNFELYKAKSQVRIAQLAMDRESSKYDWFLGLSSSLSDGNLESYIPPSYDQSAHINALTLSKGAQWGGEFLFTNSYDSYSGSINTKGFSQELKYSQDLGRNLFGRQSRRGLEIARDGIAVSKLTLQATRENRLLEFTTLYIDASNLKSLLVYQEDAHQRVLKRKNLIKRRVKDGLREKVHLLQAQNLLLEAQQKLMSSKDSLQILLKNISQQLHRPVFGKEIGALRFEKSEVPSGEINENMNFKTLKEKLELIGRKLQNTQDSQGADYKLISVYKSNKYDTQSSEALSGGVLGSDNNSISISLNATWEFGKSARDVDYGMVKIEQMNLSKEIEIRQKNLLIQDKTIIQNINTLAKVIAISQKRIDLAQRTLKEYNSLYNKGRVDLNDVITAEEKLIGNQSNYISHVSDYKKLINGLSLLYGELEKNILR